MIWEKLKIGLQTCQLKTRSKIFFLLFLVLPLQFSFSLSEEEIKALPELEKQDLINIILIYDQAMTENERDLIPLMMELQKVQTELAALRTELTLQENLSLMLSEQHKLDLKTEYNRGFRNGAITFGVIGFSLGGVGGYGIGFAIGNK